MGIRLFQWLLEMEVGEKHVRFFSTVAVKNTFGRTLVHLASFSGSTNTAEIFWCHGGGSDIDSQDDDGNTPLHLAMYYQDEKMCARC